MKSYGERWAKVPNSVKVVKVVKKRGQAWCNVMNIVTLWLKVMKSCQKKLPNCEKCVKEIKKENRNWTRFYKEILSQSFEVLQMWPRHTQPPVSEISIVSMVSMLFPCDLSGIIWHPGGMLWNAMEFHGIQKIE